jgi:hypothetical protein
VKGNGKVYICIFDGPGLPRGERSTEHNKRSTNATAYDKGTSAHQMGTSAYQMGTTAYQMGTAKSYKKQNLSVRKKQNPALRKKQNRQEVNHREIRPPVLRVRASPPPNCSTNQFIAIRNSAKPPDWHCAFGTFFHLRPK